MVVSIDSAVFQLLLFNQTNALQGRGDLWVIGRVGEGMRMISLCLSRAVRVGFSVRREKKED